MEPATRPEAATVFPGFAELSDDVHDVVNRLAALRREQGLSQTQVAARMRTSQSAVARLEAGHDDMRVSTLRRYARALGQNVRFGVAPTADDEGSV
jgi:transcriptional regulator with XRE-family HTH domain